MTTWIEMLTRNLRDAAACEQAARPWQKMLSRTYQALCGAMAYWAPPDPGDRAISDNVWARENQAKQTLYAEMHDVFMRSLDLREGVLGYRGGW